MAASFDVTGTAKLIRKQTQFHNYDPVLRRKLSRRLRKAAEPVKEAVAASAWVTLPHTNGLAQMVSSESKTSIRVILKGKNTGVRLVTSNKHAIKAMDAGRLRHPVFGNRSVWVSQEVRPGWWSRPVEDSHERIKASVQLALADFLKELANP